MTQEMHSLNNDDTEHAAFTMSVCEDSPYTPHQVDKMRRRLRYHFMTPCEKYKAKKKKPWKLAVQILKIVVVTAQVCILAAQRGSFVDFEHSSKLALKHLLLKDWDAGYETPPYPAAIGQYALYKTPDVVEHMNYFMVNYNKTADVAVGAYGFPTEQYHLKSKTSELEIKSFKTGKLEPHNATYMLNPKIRTDIIIFGTTVNADGKEEYNIEETLKEQNTSIEINRIHQIIIKFKLNAIHIREKENDIAPFETPDCLQMLGQVVYDNKHHNGRILVDLVLNLQPLQCQNSSLYETDDTRDKLMLLTFDSFVMLVCIVSLTTCARSLARAKLLGQKTRKFFLGHYGYKLAREDILYFVNFWFIMVVVSDILTVAGTGLKVAVTYKWLQYYDSCSMLLGTAHVLVWFGVLRYFEYFHKYNVLMLTLKKSFPNVIRFLLCASIFYFAFAFCGWLVLGPYHVKFITLATSAECLFSLVNGDDMFVTFSMINDKSPYSIWLFSRIYLYSFISLFIYFILNVFISVIIGTYESIQMCYVTGFPRTIVKRFAEECSDSPDSPLYRSDAHERTCLLSCCLSGRRGYEHSDDSTNIIS